MYAGHIGVALGAHGFRKAVPLWLLILAAQLPDWADAGLCLAGARSATPGMYSHSFPAVALLAMAAAILYWAGWRDIPGAFLVAAVVLSHAAADWVTGIKPTWPGGPMIGLQLYSRPAIDFVLEAAVIWIGWLIYRRSFPPERRQSNAVVAVLVALIAVQLIADVIFAVTPGLRKC
ncbi:MAG: metal-dependent hydrolase [Gemmatimonadales bacterium]